MVVYKFVVVRKRAGLREIQPYSGHANADKEPTNQHNTSLRPPLIDLQYYICTMQTLAQLQPHPLHYNLHYYMLIYSYYYMLFACQLAMNN